jgi:hypothetical protein
MGSTGKREPALGMSHNGIYDRPGPKDLVMKISDQMESSSISPATICLDGETLTGVLSLLLRG